MPHPKFALLLLLIPVTLSALADDRPWPPLPAENASEELPAQEWAFQEGPRTITAYIYYPGNALEQVNEQTGLFLSLHNWGGTNAVGTADPQFLADRYNVVAICADYLQSGPYDAATMPPYDFGYLQALDALRALFWVFDGLKKSDHPFHSERIYCTGGSGGGNVTQMANKLAPRTFAAIFDLSGMAKLNYDIAFGAEGGSYLNAGYSRNRKDPAYLSRDAHDLRDLGFKPHLETMKALGNETRIFVVHGADDAVCPVGDKRDIARNMKRAGLDLTAKFVQESDLDGTIFTNTGHGVGNRTKIVQHLADPLLLPESTTPATREGLSDFERREAIRYETRNGAWVISYETGYPVGSFVPAER